ncbi:hypothetical protein CEXT_35401 [Caerostris extrusa]|uniref:Uncharacterized protein n=1 Tax=Caerostris extrusa TaxID=172846 RepID=A0AAV4UI40_CAEEX|nr:hypothetical protein CEXT_35401 [Caerostris extrusa]
MELKEMRPNRQRLSFVLLLSIRPPPKDFPSRRKSISSSGKNKRNRHSALHCCSRPDISKLITRQFFACGGEGARKKMKGLKRASTSQKLEKHAKKIDETRIGKEREKNCSKPTSWFQKTQMHRWNDDKSFDSVGFEDLDIKLSFNVAIMREMKPQQCKRYQAFLASSVLMSYKIDSTLLQLLKRS